MFKKVFAPVFILLALATAWGQEPLDIIIRDFPAPATTLQERQRDSNNVRNYYGFQEFDYSKSESRKQCKHRPSGSQGPDSASTGMVKTALSYDKDNCPEKYLQGISSDPDYIRYRFCAYPTPASPAPKQMCYGEHLDEWYTGFKNTDTKKFFLDTILLAYNETTKLYSTDRKGYFPLDRYPDSETFGKQSGHNYGFTIAGSAEFRFVRKNNDNFEFYGDDDMWVFIDGQLVLDIGGVHSQVEGSFRINDIADKNRWKDSSMHSINFFYAERQTSESNLKLTFSLTDMSPSQLGAPYIKKAETTIKEGGSSETMIWVSTKLDTTFLQEKFIGSDQFPIIIRKSDPTNKTVSGYKLSSITFNAQDGLNGYVYVITGSVCDSKNECGLVIGAGDSLSFNVKIRDLNDAGYSAPKDFALPSDSWYVKSSIGVEATKVAWAPNTTQMPPIVFKPITGDDNPVKPDFVEKWFTGDPTNNSRCDVCGDLPPDGSFPDIRKIWDPVEGKMVDVPTRNTTVRGFGTKGTPIPPQRAGELVLTAFPNASGTVNTGHGTMSYTEWKEDEDMQKLFGLPPGQSDRGPYGIADPKKQADNGGYAFVKNGFPKESSVGGAGYIAPTRCIADRSNPDDPRINCLNFSLLAKQPFQLSVILYDQLGNFVTQYRETVTEKEFRSVVQGPNYATDEKANVKKLSEGRSRPDDNLDSICKAPTSSNYGQHNVLTTNGLVKVNVNIYPFSRDGRRFGNGVYIAKIDRVDLEYGGCMNNQGTPVYTVEDYRRYHAEQKFGWMRSTSTKSSKK